MTILFQTIDCDFNMIILILIFSVNSSRTEHQTHLCAKARVHRKCQHKVKEDKRKPTTPLSQFIFCVNISFFSQK